MNHDDDIDRAALVDAMTEGASTYVRKSKSRTSPIRHRPDPEDEYDREALVRATLEGSGGTTHLR